LLKAHILYLHQKLTAFCDCPVIDNSLAPPVPWLGFNEAMVTLTGKSLRLQAVEVIGLTYLAR